jgi:hypothetical protein
MKKNSQIHLFIETEILHTLKRQADEEDISVSELCRQKLRECSRLTKIEMILEDLRKKLNT